MTDLIDRFVLPAAYAVLPDRMATPGATAMLLAIGLQESRFERREQLEGPARGFWQFERGGGVKGVLTHAASARPLQAALRALCYPPDLRVDELHRAIADNDVLAAVCARLLLWTDALPMPSRMAGPEAAWQCYVRNWRPGKPHRNTWDSCYAEAWRRAESAPIAA